MSTNVITVKNLTKMYKLYDNPMDRLKEAFSRKGNIRYKEHYALQDVNFTVKQGETVGIIGTNGSGKSTILKIITGVLTPTEGTVTVDGRISALLELGAGFNPDYSGIDNIYLNGTMLGYSREEMTEKLDDIIEFADIGEFIHQPVKTYSSGMFVRLAFAVAINIEPEVLIVDEALSVGDVFFQAKCFRKFEEFKAQNKTILFVSHDLGSINKYCDRAILLNKGHVVEEGTPKDIIDIYKKILVNQYDEESIEKQEEGAEIDETSTETTYNDGVLWKTHFNTNQSVVEYGDKRAEIIDFCMMDSNKVITNNIEKDKDFYIKMKVKFNGTIQEPIFAYTIKDRMGNDLTGTNTLYENIEVGTKKEGDIVEVTFKQVMTLHGGDYLVSLGCTSYEHMDFVVYHRLYDAFNIMVMSEKNSVGYFDLNSKITLK
ncbi:MAG: ABC transporter ATP-binding protein [Lachnospiraceae bacterium]|nr:ABC transporter ATP-binding protein [Lachnospiraceae bacterium]